MSVEALGATADGRAFDIAGSSVVRESGLGLRPARTHTRSERVGVAATVGVPLIGLLLCVAATRTVALLPEPIQLAAPASLAGPFHYIGFSLTIGETVGVLVLLILCYLLAIRQSAHVSTRTVIWAIVAFNVIVLLGPPLFSTDVFSYQAYARIFAVYHSNPYVHVPNDAFTDPFYSYVPPSAIDYPTVYGPLFTLLSSTFASASVAFSVFAFKLMAAVTSAGTLWLIWSSARLRGLDPARAIAIFGLNPLVTLDGVGGGHNDLLMMLLTTAGVYALLIRRDRWGGGLMTAGVAIKLTGAIVLPFALLAEVGPDARRRRRTLVIAAAAVTLVIATASAVFFGSGILRLPGTLQSVQDRDSWQSVPGFLFRASGIPITSGVRIVFDIGLAAAILWLLRRVWSGRMDWIEGAAWATFAVLITAWYLLPWYICWLLPLVALSRSRRLWQAGIMMTLVAGTIMVAGCFPSLNVLP